MDPALTVPAGGVQAPVGGAAAAHCSGAGSGATAVAADPGRGNQRPRRGERGGGAGCTGPCHGIIVLRTARHRSQVAPPAQLLPPAQRIVSPGECVQFATQDVVTRVHLHTQST